MDLRSGDLDWQFATKNSLPMLNSDPDHGYFMYVPMRNSTRPSSAGNLKHEGLVASGQYCLNFDFAITDRNVGTLQLWRSWLDSGNQLVDDMQWSSSGELSIGNWQAGQILIDSLDEWTVCSDTKHPLRAKIRFLFTTRLIFFYS
jgi:MAM domain, meprin/A5/mu